MFVWPKFRDAYWIKYSEMFAGLTIFNVLSVLIVRLSDLEGGATH